MGELVQGRFSLLPVLRFPALFKWMLSIYMDALGNLFLKISEFVERLVALHRRPEIQEVSLRLWLSKDSRKESLTGYMKLFRNFLD